MARRDCASWWRWAIFRPDSEAFGALKLTETARGVLKGETEVMLREQTAGSRNRASRAKSRRGDLAPPPAGRRETGNPTLLGALEGVAFRGGAQARRAGLCRAARLHDRRHRASRPTTLAQLRGIPGIGDKKLEHYGGGTDRAGEGGGGVSGGK